MVGARPALGVFACHEEAELSLEVYTTSRCYEAAMMFTMRIAVDRIRVRLRVSKKAKSIACLDVLPSACMSAS